MVQRGVFLLAAALVGLGTSAALCQEINPAPSSAGGSYWKAELPDGVFLVPHSAISSISRSSYLVDGSVRVTEVSIGTLGSVQGRFYHAEALQPTVPVGQSSLNLAQQRAREVQSRLGLDEQATKVLKNYPTTTHAHTVEFRLASLAEVESIYQSLEDSYLRRRTVVYSAKTPQ